MKKRLATLKSVSKLRKYKSVLDSKLNDLKTRWLKKRTSIRCSGELEHLKSGEVTD